jgi:hypothetical protein
MQQRPKGSEISRYETLKQVEKSTGKTPKELINAPKLRSEAQAIWILFCELTQASYTELASYVTMTGISLSPWEVEAIMKLTRYMGEELQRWPPKSQH